MESCRRHSSCEQIVVCTRGDIAHPLPNPSFHFSTSSKSPRPPPPRRAPHSLFSPLSAIRSPSFVPFLKAATDTSKYGRTNHAEKARAVHISLCQGSGGAGAAATSIAARAPAGTATDATTIGCAPCTTTTAPAFSPGGGLPQTDVSTTEYNSSSGTAPMRERRRLVRPENGLPDENIAAHWVKEGGEVNGQEARREDDTTLLMSVSPLLTGILLQHQSIYQESLKVTRIKERKLQAGRPSFGA